MYHTSEPTGSRVLTCPLLLLLLEASDNLAASDNHASNSCSSRLAGCWLLGLLSSAHYSAHTAGTNFREVPDRQTDTQWQSTSSRERLWLPRRRGYCCRRVGEMSAMLPARPIAARQWSSTYHNAEQWAVQPSWSTVAATTCLQCVLLWVVSLTVIISPQICGYVYVSPVLWHVGFNFGIVC